MPAILSIPCDQSISGCDCTLDPSTNYSSEEPDSQVFFGSYNQAPTVGSFYAPSCWGFCESTISQDEADSCTQANAVDCSLGGAPSQGNPLWSSSRHRFGNTLQECTKECGDGNSITVDVPAGSVISYTQADADARAMGRACKRAGELLVCFVTTSPIAQGNVDAFVSVPIVATGGNGDYEFTITGGSLPPGISLDPVGLLSGMPTTAATYSFELTVADTGGGVAVKTFSWVIAGACGLTTDWCLNPGACRLRVTAFNAGEWTFAWNGNLSGLDNGSPLPCDGYFDDTGFVGLTYSGSGQYWQLSVLCPDFTTYLAILPDPTGATPIGLYTKTGGSDPACAGPNTFLLEAYSPP